MLLLLVFVTLCRVAVAVAVSDGDELLSLLGGARGGNRMSLCMGAGAAREGGAGEAVCPAALWRHQWAVARTTCLEHRRHLHEVRALRDDTSLRCDDLARGIGVSEARSIRALHVEPRHGALVLLVLDRMYPDSAMDSVANSSATHALLSEFETWLEELYLQYSVHGEISYGYKWSCYDTPLLMFMVTVVLPIVSLWILFIFVVFYTGSSEEVPYNSLSDKQEENSP